MEITETKTKPPRPMKPYTPRWYQLAYNVAKSFCPPMRPRKERGYPVPEGYCCRRGCDDNER